MRFDNQSQAARARAGWRLHLSTLILLLPVAALIVPRERTIEIEQGWPLPFVVSKKGTQVVGEKWQWDAPWRTLECWLPSEDDLKVSWSGLAVDLGLCFTVLAAVAVPLEWRRRRRRHFWQFTLAEGLAAMLLVAVVGGWLGRAKHERDAERAAIEALTPWLDYSDATSDTGQYFKWLFNDPVYDGPRWLRRLLPERSLTWFQRYRQLDLGSSPSRAVAPAPVDQVLEFRSLENLVVGHDAISADDVAKLSEARSLQSLTLSNCQVSESVVLMLFEPGGPAECRFEECAGDWRTLTPRLRRQRPDLEIVATEDSLHWQPKVEGRD